MRTCFHPITSLHYPLSYISLPRTFKFVCKGSITNKRQSCAFDTKVHARDVNGKFFQPDFLYFGTEEFIHESTMLVAKAAGCSPSPQSLRDSSPPREWRNFDAVWAALPPLSRQADSSPPKEWRSFDAVWVALPPLSRQADSLFLPCFRGGAVGRGVWQWRSF